MNVSDSNPWKVAAFGSCRVQTPLTIANADGLVSFKTDNGIGYIHNPLEIAQAIRLLNGELTAPESLYPLLNVVNPKLLGSAERYATDFEAADLIVVEISSVRIIEDGQWQLQLNRFREKVEKLGAPPQLMSKIFDPRKQEGYVRPTIEEFGLQEFFAAHRFYELDTASLDDALRKLRAKISQPVVFVGTIQNDFTGAPIPQRVMTHEALSRLASEMPETAYFDPTPFLEAAGARSVMKDLGHYTEEFEPVMAEHLAAFIVRFCESVRQVSA